MRSDLGPRAALADRTVTATPSVPRRPSGRQQPQGPLHRALARLLRHAADNVVTRHTSGDAVLGEDAGRVRVTGTTDVAPLVVRDEGLGLTPAQVRGLLRASTTGAAFVGGGIGRDLDLGGIDELITVCLRVGDRIELRSRSATHLEARTVGAVVHADGTVRMTMAGVPLDGPGTEISLHPTSNYRGALSEELLRTLLTPLAAGLPVPVEVDGVLLEVALAGAPDPGVTGPTAAPPVAAAVVAAAPAGSAAPPSLVPTTLGPLRVERIRALGGWVITAAEDTWDAIAPVARQDGLLIVDVRDPSVAAVVEGLAAGGPRVTRLQPGDLAAFGVVSA